MLALTVATATRGLKTAKAIIVDTETSSLVPWRDGQVLIGLGVKPYGGAPRYIPVRHNTTEKQASLDVIAAVVAALRGKKLIFHNAKFDLAVIYQEGFDLSNEDVEDTLVGMRLCSEDRRSYQLEDCAADYIDPTAREYKKVVTAFFAKIKAAHRKELGCKSGCEHEDALVNYADLPLADMDIYNCQDLVYTEELHRYEMPIIENRGLRELFDLEKRATRALFGMEQVGFQLDVDYVREELAKVKLLVEDLRKQINDTAGWDVNFNAAADVAKFMEQLGVHSEFKTGKGKESWAKMALQAVAVDNPVAALITSARQADKIATSYYQNFLDRMDPEGVLHCSIKQAGTRTGRTSCVEPNLQNIPRFEAFTAGIRGALTGAIMKKQAEEKKERLRKLHEIGKTEIPFDEEGGDDTQFSEVEKALFGKVRGAFVPRKDRFLLFADWGQIELRIFALYADEKELLSVFDYGLDIHRLTALAAFGSLPEDKESLEYKWVRNMGKQIAFGLIYGMGPRLLSIEIGKSQDEAKEFMNAYFARFRNARGFMKAVERRVEERGWIKNKWGRRYYLSPQASYKGVNSLVQGSAADLMKDALSRVSERLRREGLETKLLVPVHDEFIFDVPYVEAKDAVTLVIEEMSHSDNLPIPLKVDFEWSATRWSEKHTLECAPCEGYGKTLNVDQDDLLRALNRKDYKFLETVVSTTCATCGGFSVDLSKLAA
jgi:DNA polymerase-1